VELIHPGETTHGGDVSSTARSSGRIEPSSCLEPGFLQPRESWASDFLGFRDECSSLQLSNR
jgi:hypothetical protein